LGPDGPYPAPITTTSIFHAGRLVVIYLGVIYGVTALGIWYFHG